MIRAFATSVKDALIYSPVISKQPPTSQNIEKFPYGSRSVEQRNAGKFFRAGIRK